MATTCGILSICESVAEPPRSTRRWLQRVLPDRFHRLRRLIEASKTPVRGPSWWTQDLGFFGTVETRIARTDYRWDGMKRLGKADPPFLFFAGWEAFELYDEAPQRMTPGKGFWR